MPERLTTSILNPICIFKTLAEMKIVIKTENSESIKVKDVQRST